jgi:bla regulator protein BlaR1
MKIVRAVAVLVVIAVSLAVLPHLQALPYFALDMPAAPPAPPTPPAPPAPPAMASIDVVPEPPEPPEPPAPPERWSWSHHDGEGDSYVLSYGDMNVVNVNGDTDFRELRHAYGRQFFWFRHDGRAYVVRDAATIQRLIDLYRPQNELGREQGELGRKQGELGRKQGELGRRQGELGREQGHLGVEQARMSRFDDDDPSSFSRRRDLERRERELSRRQDDLGREQDALGREQSKLGEEQSRLGERQSALSREIERKIKPMLDEMIRKGIAERAH